MEGKALSTIRRCADCKLHRQQHAGIDFARTCMTPACAMVIQVNAGEGRKLKAALALRFPRIPSSLLLEPVFVFTLVRLAYVQDTRLHTYQVLYEVMLPHLLQSRCFAEAYEEGHCVFESIPLDSIHSWERVLCHTAFRNMLRRNGITQGEIAVLWLRIKEEIYTHFRAAASSAQARYIAVEARRAMCAAAARALGKQLISVHKAAAVAALAEYRFLSAQLRTSRKGLGVEDERTEHLAPADLATEVKHRAVSENDLVRIIARRLPLTARGIPRLHDAAELVHHQNVLRGPEGAAVDASGCLTILSSAVLSCDQIRSGGLDNAEEDLSVVLDAFQIVNLIVSVCCEKLPSLGDAAVISAALGQRAHELLQLLYKLAVHLMAAGSSALTVSWSPHQNKEVGASVAVCCSALFAWADAIVRTSDMATAHQLRSFSGKLCPTNFGGTSLADVTALLHPTPPLLDLRHEVLSYWQSLEGDDATLLWDWRGLDNSVEQLTDGVASIPAVEFALRFISPTNNKAEAVLAASTLLVSTWEVAPEMAVLRDMSVLATFSLHQGDGQGKQAPGVHWTDLQALTPAWSLKQTGGAVQLQLKMLRSYTRGLQVISPDAVAKFTTWKTQALVGMNYNIGSDPVANTTDALRDQEYSGIDPRGHITEHSLLFGAPPAFGQQLGSDEAEMLMSTLLVPYLRLPIFLRFVSDGRASVLGNTAFRMLFVNIVAEPGPWVSTSCKKIPTTVPAHVKVRGAQGFLRKGGEAGVLLGTRSGFLAEEFRLDPVGVASMAASIVNQLVELFTGGEIVFFAEKLSSSTSMDPDSAMTEPSSVQAGLLCGMWLSAIVECLARKAGHEEGIGICNAARIRATELLEAQVESALMRNGGSVDSGILQVVASTLSAWRWASNDEIRAKAGVLLGWCAMIRVWLRHVATAGNQVAHDVLPSICMHGWAAAASRIGEQIGGMLGAADESERNAVLGNVATVALSSNCPYLAGSWEPCGSFQWTLQGVRINALTAAVSVHDQRYSEIPNAIKRHSTFAELFSHSLPPTECTILNRTKEESVVKVWSAAAEFIVQVCPKHELGGSKELPTPLEVGAAEVRYDGEVWRPAAPIDAIKEHVNIETELVAWFEPDNQDSLLRVHERLIQTDDKWLLLRCSSGELYTLHELYERCGELHEIAVFTSNDRWCSSCLPLPIVGTSFDRFPVGQRFEHPCELGRSAAVADVCPIEDFDLALFRRRGDKWDEYVPHWKLQSLLPAALVAAFRFWKLGESDELYGEGLASTATVTVNLRTGEVTRKLDGVQSHLLCIADAEAGTPWARLAETLMRAESLGQVLVWAARNSEEQQLLPVLVELPRLRTELRPRTDKEGCTRLHLKEDPVLFLAGVVWGCDQQPDCPNRYLPWELLLTDGKSKTVLLVPNVRPCARGEHPATRSLDFDDGCKARADAVVRRYYLYSVTHAGVEASGRAAALYLFVLRLHQRQYEMAISLVNQCASTLPYSAEEAWVVSLLATTTMDSCPDAAACRLSVFEILHNGTAVSWNVVDDAWRYLQGHLRVACPCLLDANAERCALKRVASRSRPSHGLHRRFPIPGQEEPPEPMGRALHLVKTRIEVLSGMPESALPPPVTWSAGGGWRRLEAGLASSLRDCLEDFTKDGDCWQDKLSAPALAAAQDGPALCSLYDAVLTPGPSAGAPAAFLTLCAARSGELPVGFAGSAIGGATFVDIAARWVYLIGQSIQEHGAPVRFDEEADVQVPPTAATTRSRTPWPRECTLLMCALSALSKPVYPPAKTMLGGVSLKSLANRKNGPLFNWAWAFMHAAFTAVSSVDWMERNAPAGQKLRWGLCSNGGYGSATVLQRTFSVKDTLNAVRRCKGGNQHPLHDVQVTWMPPEAKPPSPYDESYSKLPFQLDVGTTEMTSSATGDKLARLERSLVAFRTTRRLETVPSVFYNSLPEERSAASMHLMRVIELLTLRHQSATEEYQQVMHDLRIANLARHNGLTVDDVGRKLMELAGIAPKVTMEHLSHALASTQGKKDLQSAFPGLDATRALRLAAKGMLLQSQQLQIGRALSISFTMQAMLASDAVDPMELKQLAARLTEELSSQVYHARQVAGGVAYDPRILLFENCASIKLRAGQVALLQQISDQIHDGESRVHQMIMGQGKTTVITPVLVLMWSSKQLVTITVPPALLNMAHSCLLVLAKLQKRTVMVTYSRMCPDGTNPITRAQTLCRMLQRARVSESAVLSTPQTLKSVILHFIEMQAQLCGCLPIADDRLDQHSTDWSAVFTPQAQCAAIRDELQQCLALWNQGLLILDEADVVFHPLKSELLFPVGNVLDVALTKPRIHSAIHLLAGMLDGACPVLKEKLDEAITAREITCNPHLLLVDREGYDRFVPDLAAWMWRFLEEELKESNAQLLKREPVNLTATSVLDAEHGPERAVGGEITGLEPQRGEDQSGVGFWCSAEYPGSCEVSFEVKPPAWLRTLRIQYKAVSAWPGRSGKIMIPSNTVVELSSDGGKTFPLVVRLPMLNGDGEHDGVQLPDAPKITHVRLKLTGEAQWFAIRDIFFMVQQDEDRAMHLDRDTAVAYLTNSQCTTVESAVPYVRDLMRATHNLIHSLLPHALSKVYRVDYGLIEEGDNVQVEPSSDESLLPPRRLLTAVPFIGKDSPSPTAEFAHPDVIILLSLLSYRYAGLRETDTTVLVAHMKDAQAAEGGPAQLRPSGKLFQRWLEDSCAGRGKVLLPLSMVDMGDRWQAEAIHSALKHHRPAQSHYLSKIVLPTCLTYHASRLGATGEELGDSAVFGQRLAYTGTPNDLLPKAMGSCCYEALADGQMLDTLSSPDCVKYERMAGEWDVGSLLASIATHDPPFCSLIDPGALVVGMSNRAVAQTLLECGLAQAGMHGVVFLDSNDDRMILLVDGRVMPLAESGVATHLRFTFFDQQHTCGMDIPQPLTGRAAVLIGKGMQLRDYTQACWRMRGIGVGQIVHAMVVDEVSRLVSRVANTKNPAADLLAWLTVNEIETERLQRVRLKELHARTDQRRPAFEVLMQNDSEGNIEVTHVQPYLTAQLWGDSTATASREMDAEVEVEKEMEVQNQNVYKKPYVQYWSGYDFDEEPWSVDALASSTRVEAAAQPQFWTLQQFRPDPRVSALPFPSTVFVSHNHSFSTEEHCAVQSQRGGAPSRVKNVRCALVWEWQGDAGDALASVRRGVAAVSLAEAETLRWLLHHAPSALGPDELLLSLWDVTTSTKLGGGAVTPTAEEVGALRLFNCDVWLDPRIAQCVTQTLLASVQAEDVSLWMYHMMVLRRRDWKMAPRAFESSPVGQVLQALDN